MNKCIHIWYNRRKFFNVHEFQYKNFSWRNSRLDYSNFALNFRVVLANGGGMIFARMFICFKKGGRGSKCLIWNFFEQNIRDKLTNINIFCSLKKNKTFLKFLFRWFKWALKFSRFFVSSNQNKTDFFKKLGQDQITDHTIYTTIKL